MKRRERRYKKVNVLKNKRFYIVTILGFCMIILFFALRKTGAIFQTETSSEANIDIAFYCIKEDFQTMTLKLDNILPRSTPYSYDFTISNNNGTKRTETELQYDLSIRTTTNLPLDIKLYDTNTGMVEIGTVTIMQDSDDTFFRIITVPQREFGFLNNQTDKFTIEVILPEIYKSHEYQDIIELIEINVDSKQKI